MKQIWARVIVQYRLKNTVQSFFMFELILDKWGFVRKLKPCHFTGQRRGSRTHLLTVCMFVGHWMLDTLWPSAVVNNRNAATQLYSWPTESIVFDRLHVVRCKPCKVRMCTRAFTINTSRKGSRIRPLSSVRSTLRLHAYWLHEMVSWSLSDGRQ